MYSIKVCAVIRRSCFGECIMAQDSILTRHVIEKIQSYLGNCSQKVIARYIGVTPVALSQNIEKPFASIIENRVGARLNSLLFLLECIQPDETLDASTLHRLLTLPAFKDKSGWKLDVVSAIHEDYEKTMLFEIFQRAVEALRKPLKQMPIKDGLYSAIHARQA